MYHPSLLFYYIAISITCLLLCSSCHSFLVFRNPRNQPSHQLDLVPISTLENEFTFLNQQTKQCFDDKGTHDGYTLSLVEEGDLVELARLTVEVFGTEVVRIGSSTEGSIESMLLTPAVQLVNGYSGLVAFAEVLAGLRSRTRERHANDNTIAPPALTNLSRDEQMAKVAATSLVLAVGKPKPDNSWQSEIVASVELRLQPCDAKIPFSFPWIDRIERKLATLVGFTKTTNTELHPYLSNLCVDERFRGRGLGKDMVAVVEDIASTTWGYSKLYLHVDPNNEAAYGLYTTRGYKEAKLRWKPAWAGSSSDIAYLVKSLGTESKAR